MNKPRLIDANALLDVLALEPMENRTYWRANEIVLEQPTAYDIDKVVEQLSEKKALHEDLINYERQVGTIYERMQHEKAVEVLGEAIEIVKGGGSDE